MTAREMSPGMQRSLVQAAVLDSLCIFAGVGLFLMTGNWIWVAAGVLLGAGFLLPALIQIMRSRKS